MNSRIPLKGYLSLHFGAVAVLPVITIACLVWLFMMPAMQTRTGIQHQAMARSIAGQISAHLKGGARQLTALAEYFQHRSPVSVSGGVDLLDAQCGKGAFFEALFVVDNAEVTIQAVGLVQSRRPQRADFLGLDLSGRSFINPPEELKRACWSKTFLSTVSSRMAVALTVPLANGSITGEITLDKLSEFVSHLPVKSEFLILVIDDQGRIVADSQKRRSGQVLNINYPVLEETGGGKQATSTAFELDGIKMLGTVVKMDPVDWNVLVAQPFRKAFQPLRNTFVLIGLGLAIALGLALSISWFLAGNLTDLFTTYAERAESIANGCYRLQWPAARAREFSKLDQSLKRMAEKISWREKELIDSENRLKDLIANVPGVMYQFSVDPEHPKDYQSIVMLPEKLNELFGLELEPKTYFDDFFACLPEEDRPRFIASIQEAVEKVKPWHYEGRFIKPSGEEVWIEGNSTPRQFGDRIVFYGLFTDITWRKEMESSLRLAQFIIDTANVGIYRINPDGRIIEVNQKAAQLLGYTKEELETLTMADIDTLVARKSWDPNWRKITAQGTRNLEAQHRRKDGSVFPVEVHSNLLKYEGQLYAIAFVQDITERKRNEKFLRLAQFIIDSANIGIYRVDPDGRIVEVNQKAAQLLGYTKEELETLSILDIDPSVTREGWSLIWQDLLDQGHHFIEREHRKKDGCLIPIEVYGNLLEYEGQQYSIAFVQDITERKQAERSLRENEQLLGNILESMNEGVFVLDSEFKNTIYNKGMEVITNVPREAVIGKRPWEAFPHIKKSPVEDNIRNVMNGEVSVAVETTHPHNPDVWSRDSFSPLKDTDGRVIGVVGVLTDITRQKQDEEEVRRLRNYLSNIIDSMPSIIVAVDCDGNVTQWNHRTEQSTGLTYETVRCQSLANVFPRLSDEMERIRISIRERRVIRSPKVSRQVDNETRFEDITIFPLVANGVEGAVIRVDDVTQQVRLQEMMIQSEKMMSVGGLAAGMAHEINNPLAGILQNASVMENRLLGDLPANYNAAEAAGTTLVAIQRYLSLRKLPEMIGNIRDSGNRAAAIVRNMLSFARKSEKIVSTHELGTLLDQSIDLLKTDYDMKKHYDFKQIEIVRQYDKSAGPVSCEASKIQQVFMNILKNGAEAMTEVSDLSVPPAFVLRVKDDGAWVRVEIEDNGPGMDEKTRRRIFEPFFTTKPVGKGTGLGLSVSYFIVNEDHGGQMSAHAAEGGGTCFVIRLPKAGKE